MLSHGVLRSVLLGRGLSCRLYPSPVRADCSEVTMITSSIYHNKMFYVKLIVPARRIGMMSGNIQATFLLSSKFILNLSKWPLSVLSFYFRSYQSNEVLSFHSSILYVFMPLFCAFGLVLSCQALSLDIIFSGPLCTFLLGSIVSHTYSLFSWSYRSFCYRWKNHIHWLKFLIGGFLKR